MKRSILTILVVFVILSVSPTIQGSISTRTSDRAAGYDNGGNLKIYWVQGPFVRDEVERKIREFIWSRWTLKRSARITATYCGIDSSSKSVFFIKKNSHGKWLVVEKFVEKSTWFWQKDEVTINTFYDVDRVEVMTSAESSEIPKMIPKGEDRTADSYRLRLKAGSPADDFIL